MGSYKIPDYTLANTGLLTIPGFTFIVMSETPPDENSAILSALATLNLSLNNILWVDTGAGANPYLPTIASFSSDSTIDNIILLYLYIANISSDSTIDNATLLLTLALSSIADLSSDSTLPDNITLVFSTGDNFNRSSLGSNWTTITNEATPIITASSYITTPEGAGAYWNADTFSSNQWSECYAQSFSSTSGYRGSGPRIRVSPSAQTYYGVSCVGSSEVDGGWELFKMINGTKTTLASGLAEFWDGSFRLEIQETTIILRNYSYHVPPEQMSIVTTIIDASISSGQPGFGLAETGGVSSYVDNWYGGNM